MRFLSRRAFTIGSTFMRAYTVFDDQKTDLTKLRAAGAGLDPIPNPELEAEAATYSALARRGQADLPEIDTRPIVERASYVDTVAALLQVDDAPLNEGREYFCQQLLDWFVLTREPVGAPDGETVFAAFSGHASWLRACIPHSFWVRQTAWHVDEAHGSNLSTGRSWSAGTGGEAVRTIDEWYRRTGGVNLPGQLVDINVHGATYDQPIVFDTAFGQGSTVRLNADLGPSLRTGVLTTAVMAAVAFGSDATLVGDGVTNFALHVGHTIVFATTPTPSQAHVIKAVGVGQALVSFPSTIDPLTGFAAQITVPNGTAFSLYAPTHITQTVQFRPRASAYFSPDFVTQIPTGRIVVFNFEIDLMSLVDLLGDGVRPTGCLFHLLTSQGINDCFACTVDEELGVGVGAQLSMHAGSLNGCVVINELGWLLLDDHLVAAHWLYDGRFGSVLELHDEVCFVDCDSPIDPGYGTAVNEAAVYGKRCTSSQALVGPGAILSFYNGARFLIDCGQGGGAPDFLLGTGNGGTRGTCYAVNAATGVSDSGAHPLTLANLAGVFAYSIVDLATGARIVRL